jgi:hypothetical protein
MSSPRHRHVLVERVLQLADAPVALRAPFLVDVLAQVLGLLDGGRQGVAVLVEHLQFLHARLDALAQLDRVGVGELRVGAEHLALNLSVAKGWPGARAPAPRCRGRSFCR